MQSKQAAQAQAGVAQIEEAILSLLAEYEDGLINNEIARALGLESDFQGRQRNYLTYSVLGGMMKKGLIVREQIGRRQPFKKVERA